MSREENSRMMMLVDSHAHLDDARFAGDLEAVLERARAAGVGRIITIGTGPDSSRAAVGMIQSHPGFLFACVGIHPHDADGMDEAAWATLAELAGAPGVVGIGETGLDYHYNHSSRAGQRRAFIRQIELAAQRGLPLVVHCREAYPETLAALGPYRGRIRGVAHCFSGDMRAAEAFLGLGFYLSFAGTLTFPKAEELRAVAAQVPLERILIETDCPYLGPVPWRGKRNEPAHLTATAEALDRLRGDPVAAVTARNAELLFGLTATQ